MCQLRKQYCKYWICSSSNIRNPEELAVRNPEQKGKKDPKDPKEEREEKKAENVRSESKACEMTTNPRRQNHRLDNLSEDPEAVREVVRNMLVEFRKSIILREKEAS